MTKYEEIKEAASKTPPLKQSTDTKEKKEEEESGCYKSCFCLIFGSLQ
jgi:hypothetical protein